MELTEGRFAEKPANAELLRAVCDMFARLHEGEFRKFTEFKNLADYD